MATINDLDIIKMPVPEPSTLRYKGRWIDNGILSNMHRGDAAITYRDLSTHQVEKAYVAAKNPTAWVSHRMKDGSHFEGHFIDLISRVDTYTAKFLGKPPQRGGLIESRDDWEEVCIAAMWSFQAQKYAPGTREREWLLGTSEGLVEWTNWGDQRWGIAVLKNGSAQGRNALGRIVTLIRDEIRSGREPAVIEENEWAGEQEGLIERMNKVEYVDVGEERQPSLF